MKTQYTLNTLMVIYTVIITACETTKSITNDVNKTSNSINSSTHAVTNLSKAVKNTDSEINQSSRKNNSSSKNYNPNQVQKQEYKSSSARLISFQGEYTVTKNLFVNINGKYPSGYEPKWRLVGDPQDLELNYEQYISKMGVTKRQKIKAGITEYQEKTVLSFRAIGCDCAANLELPSDKITLSEEPIRFNLTNFRKIQAKSLDDPNASCQNLSSYTHGGWKGFVVLSADNQGNLNMDIRLENYSQLAHSGSKLSYTWFDNNISIPNTVTPNVALNKAIAIDESQKESIKRQEEYANYKAKRQDLDSKYLLYKDKVNALPATKTATIATYKGYALKKPIRLENLITKSTKSDALTKAQGAYYKKLAYDFTFNANALEPHDRDAKFALKYSAIALLNRYAINIATYALIQDDEKLRNAAQELDQMEYPSDDNEYHITLGYLRSKN